jgi:uncharacterized protein
MTQTFLPRQLDVAAFAQARGALEGRDMLSSYERLARDLQATQPDQAVNWQVQGESRGAADGSVRPALHLRADAALPLTCQRCLGPVLAPVHIDAHFIFMPDEAAAAALDDESEDDVLALSSALDLHALIEDELLLALPLVPRHDACPHAVQLSAQDGGFDAASQNKVHPFAALGALKDG